MQALADPCVPYKDHGSIALQVAALEILARLYIERDRFEAATAVYAALAERRSGLGDAAVQLDERLDRLQAAELQARAVRG